MSVSNSGHISAQIQMGELEKHNSDTDANHQLRQSQILTLEEALDAIPNFTSFNSTDNVQIKSDTDNDSEEEASRSSNHDISVPSDISTMDINRNETHLQKFDDIGDFVNTVGTIFAVFWIQYYNSTNLPYDL